MLLNREATVEWTLLRGVTFTYRTGQTEVGREEAFLFGIFIARLAEPILPTLTLSSFSKWFADLEIEFHRNTTASHRGATV
jgi:hypothetical protein